MRVLRIAAVAAALLLSGCVTDKVDVNAPGPEKDSSVFVMGLSPDYTQVVIIEGRIEHGAFYHWDRYHIYEAKDGFIIGHIAPGDVLGVTSVHHFEPGEKPEVAPITLFQPHPKVFSPCDSPGARLIAFSAPAGKVVYLTSITTGLDSSATGLSVSIKSDFAGAKAYLQSHYPLLADKLEQGTIELTQPGTCY